MITYSEWAKEQRSRELLLSDPSRYLENVATRVWMAEGEGLVSHRTCLQTLATVQAAQMALKEEELWDTMIVDIQMDYRKAL